MMQSIKDKRQAKFRFDISTNLTRMTRITRMAKITRMARMTRMGRIIGIKEMKG